jgi:hypothetical protein
MPLFQFFHDALSRAHLEPEFTPLDNTRCERPDLPDYWPIRTVLQTHTFADDELLGFFSDRFAARTALTGQQVVDCVAGFGGDILSFSPDFEQIACHPNSFVQAEEACPGFLDVAHDTLQALGIELDLRTLMQDQTRIIFSNYFVAQYRWWRQWLALAERVVQIADTPGSALGARLNARAGRPGAAAESMKSLLLERLVSVLLERSGHNAVLGIDFGRAPLSGPDAEDLFGVMLGLDALKGHYIKTRSPLYLRLYAAQRHKLLQARALAASPALG